MNRRWIITLLVCLLIVGSGAGVLLWPRTVPLAQCSEVYRLYVNNPSIKASFIKDFRINDSVSVDVTLLEAVDSNGWNMLCKDFFIPELDPFSKSRIDGGKDLIFTKLINKKDIPQLIEKNYSGNIIRSVSFIKKTICIFYIKNEDEEHAVLYYNFDKSTNQ